MSAVFLDAATLGDDIDLTPMEEAARGLTCYQRTAPDQVLERIRGFGVVVTNKVVLNQSHFDACPDLHTIVLTATGKNNIDLPAAEAAGITVLNATRYGTSTVAQHTVALMLALATHLIDYHQDVQAGAWAESPQFCLMNHPVMELEGKTLCIVGFGDIGRAVARRAEAFGMKVVLGARPGQSAGDVDGYPRAPIEELLPHVDVLSLHCLLTPETDGLIGASELAAMKNEALIINTSRGGLVDETALAEALRERRIGGAGFDVLTGEPPRNGNPLLAGDIPNLIVTPHCAWASREARQSIVEKTAENLRNSVHKHATG
ncbi:glycerate dehydrogenase [Tamilnaduibacter salinus]|uniref:Glycerate dehydrogenase n=1 Tax=Tamilnaduibacter salinus TaxID=1484056 RepID=A0A2U1CW05_9GAMM|nr:D-2-hydroxyacid dehydrogenase [Tamilnaduibacter salinus]PVY75828.1 glycerate dehydrogenase [Tamilnaduibacter salinus]